MDFKTKLSKVETIQQAADLRELLDPLSKEWQESEDKLRELLKNKYKDEEVLVVHKDLMPDFKGNRYVNFEDVGQEVFDTLEKNVSFMPRYKAEYNPTYKQVIPYAIAINGIFGDETYKEEIFAMVRKQGDPRLVGNISLGIGGHINPVDVDNETGLFMIGLKRELNEEVNISKDNAEDIELEGYIYDPTNIVGQDHLGLVYIIMLKNSNISIKETDTLEGKFMTLKELRDSYDKAENWSRLAIDNLL